MTGKENVILIYLIACALHDTKPDDRILNGVDVRSLFALASTHSLSAIVYMALEKTEFFQDVDLDVQRRWKELKERTLRKNIILDAERRHILSELEKRHIWYIPLKGSVIKSMYPKEEMREMADIDILYDATFQREVKEVFRNRGYKTISCGRGNHDVYEKEPLYNFEMHTALFPRGIYPEFSDIFDNYSDIAIKDEDSAYGRHFGDEDFYVYVIAHSYKHYDGAGIGLRALVDLYVMEKSFGATINREYISKQLKKLKIDDYELNSRRLARTLFDRAEPIEISNFSVEQQLLLSEYFCAGTYGTLERQITNSLKKYSCDGDSINRKTKVKYILKRIFPDRKWCRINYPLCYKYPFLIPFMWIYRMLKVIIYSRKRISAEIKAIISSSKDYGCGS